MPLGPFDRRTKRFRCITCAASHSKCSGCIPCMRCQKRSIRCVFPVSPPSENGHVIMLDRGKTHTIRDFVAPSASYPRAPFPHATTRYFFYFDLFVRRNSFTGREPFFLADVQNAVKSSGTMQRYPCPCLLDAMLALGAMHATLIGALEYQAGLRFATESYMKSVAGLREAVTSFSSSQRDTILWTTLFLGLFELMQDASGQKWLQHMVFGTSKALIASGPATCNSGTMRRFFVQARSFEVCRSIIFNQPSFLAAPEWIDLTDSLSKSSVAMAQDSLDELLKLIVLCSALRARTAEFIESITGRPNVEGRFLEAMSIATEGFNLRESLESWKGSAVFPPERREEMLLSTVWYSATSIYLSGNYDYDLPHWQAMGVGVQVLDSAEIAKHFDAIILTVKEAMRASSLSPLMFLFPLRIAGARAKQRWQQCLVKELLQEVRKNFIVADAMLTELAELWSLSTISS
ncbi:uncharacterized protein LY79DRAFT_598583 [Colletotrichum navitas]|uniref:Zn(2)-C6 fungal-type domain-containing protein n=1 Tax=Colletotrichum navitas TaxID=681940 RepID=A0AAD8V9P4_9PEZI|nr:uncharacterized protein LY79DRAFT_598583 [Colletotrichum navitas]KAK1598204.1 hypothetical protein LY79DRAFT_598583 [Colletotrichum navitas]